MTYAWSTGENTQTITLAPTATTTVSVQVENHGCVTTDMRFLEMNCSLIFPNAFTPNGDGMNDRFMPHLVNIDEYDFFVYNRWGQLLFSSTGNTGSSADGWDGTFNGEMQPLGVYVYYAQGFDIKGQPVKAEGHFTLLR
jgi:gliding motility-associated-like protein